MNLAKHDPETEMPMNMTPMIDVVFLLIIFFMIITDMTQQDLEELVLPVAAYAVPDKPDMDEWRPVLNIPYDGRWIVRQEVKYDPEVDDAKPEEERYKQIQLWLNEASLRMKKEHFTTPSHDDDAPTCSCGQTPYPHPQGSGVLIPGEALLIRADESTSFRHIQKVMEFCGIKGIEIWKVQLAVSEPEPDDKPKP